MIDHACDDEFENAIRECVAAEEGVLRIDELRTREFGNKIYVDIEIAADGNMPLKDAHAIAEQVHDHMEERFPKVKHVMVHVNPYTE
jgi:divalent metal cation (Fe/Co/Zn/Cd) transporter